MRGRELCREANESQNWFADIMRTGRVVRVPHCSMHPRIFRICEREFCMRKGAERQRSPPPPRKHKFSLAILRRFSREVRIEKCTKLARLPRMIR